jgi:hypothetical protein
MLHISSDLKPVLPFSLRAFPFYPFKLVFKNRNLDLSRCCLLPYSEVAMASDIKPASDDEMNYPKNEKFAVGEPEPVYDGYSVAEGEDVLALQDVDPALNSKMHLVNNVRGSTSAIFPIRI